MRSPLPVFLLLVSAAAAAQALTIGSLNSQAGLGVAGEGVVIIDKSHPATADGTITNASVGWYSIGGCPAGFTIRIVRPSDDGTGFSTVGETPPLPVTPHTGVLHVSFPGIAVKKGDLLGIVQGISNCGTAVFTYSPVPADSVIAGGRVYSGMRLAAIASAGAQHLAGVVPVVGSVQGAGAVFRTSLQLTNPTGSEIEGVLFFRPGDAALPFILGPHASTTYDDIAAAFGRTGIGSLDVFTSSFTPDVTARVFNDAAIGTFGLTEELVRPEEMLSSNVQFATIPIPRDLTNFRVNVGVRTLDSPVQVVVTIQDANGTLLGEGPAKTFDGNSFEQVPLASFIGTTPPAGGSLVVSVRGGPIVFYTSTIDNRTNDSALRMIVAR